VQKATWLVDLYLARQRVRAQVPTGNFQRLSDFLNNSPGGYLSGTSQLVSELAHPTPETWTPHLRDLVVSLAEVRFVHPIAEAAAVNAAELYRDRVRVSVELELDAWHLSGTLYLLDRVRWSDYLRLVRTRFVPLGQASAHLAGAAAPFESDLLLLNGARISALYADPA
jgi:hypothetical protein